MSSLPPDSSSTGRDVVLRLVKSPKVFAGLHLVAPSEDVVVPLFPRLGESSPWGGGPDNDPEPPMAA